MSNQYYWILTDLIFCSCSKLFLSECGWTYWRSFHVCCVCCIV